MNAIAAAIAALFADPNIAVDAIYRAGGAGEGIAVRIAWRAPDQVTEFGGGRFVTQGRMLDARIAEIAALAAGDSFEINSRLYIVMGDPRRDDEGLIWRAEVKPGS